VKRYKLDPIRIAPPAKGFLIQTPIGKTLFDTQPRGIVRELNRLNDRIKELEAKIADRFAVGHMGIDYMVHGLTSFTCPVCESTTPRAMALNSMT